MIKLRYRGEAKILPLEEYNAVELLNEVVKFMKIVDAKMDYGGFR